AADGAPVLLWLCEPCNPTGRSLPETFWLKLARRLSAGSNCIVAIDRAYEPLRLHGTDPVAPELAARCWQLYSPNKALGLTGVRAGWVLAPEEDVLDLLPALWRLAPSWVLSAEGVSLLSQWPSAAVQNWLAHARATLGTWMAQQQAALSGRGWVHQASCTNFTLSRHPDLDEPALNALNACLRSQGIKWRDAGNLGLPGWVRWRAHQPVAQETLLQALDQ
ncbi:MAG: aminotransferase class I/II-fold pyridoxal phosphate-dependent enzyme, partial [Aquabacterium sp.]|uniref:aminotransferase class I/II-fold pyridoxal phosphate-dependent enzyme n=1 Tax=Aquabacterium sp. TaxID=1872578 RepID=UPI001222ED70